MKKYRHVLVASLLAAACVLPGCTDSTSPAARAMTFNQLIADSKHDEAIRMVDETAVAMFGRDKMLESLTQAATEMKDKGGLSRQEVVSEEVGEEEATVLLNVEYGNGSSEEHSTKLTKADEEWLITFSK